DSLSHQTLVGVDVLGVHHAQIRLRQRLLQGTHVNALLGKTVLAIVGCPHHLLFTAEWLIEAARLVDGQVPTFGVHAGLEPRNETLSPLRLISHPRWRFPSGGATLGVTRTTREQGPCACHNQQSQAIHLSTSSSHY